MIREGKTKEERFTALKEIAEYQLRILKEAQHISNRIEKNDQVKTIDLADVTAAFDDMLENDWIDYCKKYLSEPHKGGIFRITESYE